MVSGDWQGVNPGFSAWTCLVVPLPCTRLYFTNCREGRGGCGERKNREDGRGFSEKGVSQEDQSEGNLGRWRGRSVC